MPLVQGWILSARPGMRQVKRYRDGHEGVELEDGLVEVS